MLQDSDVVICVSVVQDQKRLGYTTKANHLACLLADGCDSLALRMVNKFVISTSPLVTSIIRLSVTQTRSRRMPLGARRDGVTGNAGLYTLQL